MKNAPHAVTTDEAMISNIKKETYKDWTNFVHKYSPLVYHWCRRSGFTPEDSADIIQNVFFSVYRSIHTFNKNNNTHSFRSWLWKITRHRICDFANLKKGKPTACGGTELNQLLNNHPDPNHESESSYDEDSLFNLLHIAMTNVSSQVNDHTWQAFELLSFESYSPKEVAELLGMSQAAVRMLKSRVLKKLREEIERLKQC